MKMLNLFHHGIISTEFDAFYYELLRVKEAALRSSSASPLAAEEQIDVPKTITVSGPVLSLQERVVIFFNQQREKLHRVSIGPNAIFIQEALYVFITLADEIMINLPWHGADYWRKNCLETKIFQTQVGGEKIFTQIDSLLKTNDPLQRELARVYLLSLSLGFQGRFREQDNHQILSYKQQLFSFIYHRSPRLIQGGYDNLLDDSLMSVFTETPTKGLPDIRPWSLVALSVIIIYLFVSYGVWTIISQDLHEVLQGIFHLTKQGPVI